MKLLLPVACLFVFCLKSQNNQLDINSKWHVTSYAKDFECYSGETINHYFRGDSIINGNQYLKVSFAGIHQGYPSGQFSGCPTNSYSYDGNTTTLVRYHQKKMLIWSRATNQDSVFLDYNLAVGDTITNVGYTMQYGSNLKLPVTTIDSVLVNGIYLKRFYYQHMMGAKYIIEKIGSSSGFLQPYSIDFESGSSLICYSENFTTVYNEPSASSPCDVTVDISVHTGMEHSVSIYPNPITTAFMVSTGNNERLRKVSLKNYLGQLVLEETNPSTNQKYNLPDLNAGIYFAEIETEQGTTVKKIIKQ